MFSSETEAAGMKWMFIGRQYTLGDIMAAIERERENIASEQDIQIIRSILGTSEGIEAKENE